MELATYCLDGGNGLTKSLELFPACAAGSLSGGMMTTVVEGGRFDNNGR
jgi:hypothetical protein